MQNYIIKDLFYFLDYIYLLQIHKHKRAKIKIKQKQLNPVWYVKRSHGRNADSQIVYTSTITKDYIIFHYKNNLYSHPWKSNVLIDNARLDSFEASETSIPDYECTVTK